MLTIRFGDDDEVVVEKLRNELAGVQALQVCQSSVYNFVRLRDNDAFYAAFPYAEYLSKTAIPPTAIGEARVLDVKDTLVATGLPKLFITGGIVCEEDRNNPLRAIRSVLGSILRAAADFNRKAKVGLLSIIAIPADAFSVDEFGSQVIGGAIRTVYLEEIERVMDGFMTLPER